MPSHNKAAWLAVDWGTSRLRVWGVDSSNAVVGARQSERGAAQLTAEEFEPHLIETAAELLDGAEKMPVLVCGMAGARNRWSEAPYLPVPCAPADIGARPHPAPARTGAIAPYILCGLSQDAPANVMRGEETQIVGLLSRLPGYDGALCLPGTHSKWVRVAEGKVQGFDTVMSGELYHLIGTLSMLRDVVSANSLDEKALVTAAAQVLDAPQKAAAMLFSIRAESLLSGLPADAARGRLSGWLLGMELAATAEYWSDSDVVLIGEQSLCRQYALVLESLGVGSQTLTAEDMALAGLIHLYPIAQESLL